MIGRGARAARAEITRKAVLAAAGDNIGRERVKGHLFTTLCVFATFFGIVSLAGCAAAAGIPLTLRGTALAVTFLTEVTSNTATTTLLMPVLAAAAVGLGGPLQRHQLRQRVGPGFHPELTGELGRARRHGAVRGGGVQRRINRWRRHCQKRRQTCRRGGHFANAAYRFCTALL